jgi:hypothetical protein
VKSSTTRTTTQPTGPSDTYKRTAQPAPESSVTARMAHLQRTAGNTAVLRMLRERTAPGSEAPETPDPAPQALGQNKNFAYNG